MWIPMILFCFASAGSVSLKELGETITTKLPQLVAFNLETLGFSSLPTDPMKQHVLFKKRGVIGGASTDGMLVFTAKYNALAERLDEIVKNHKVYVSMVSQHDKELDKEDPSAKAYQEVTNLWSNKLDLHLKSVRTRWNNLRDLLLTPSPPSWRKSETINIVEKDEGVRECYIAMGGDTVKIWSKNGTTAPGTLIQPFWDESIQWCKGHAPKEAREKRGAAAIVAGSALGGMMVLGTALSVYSAIQVNQMVQKEKERRAIVGEALGQINDKLHNLENDLYHAAVTANLTSKISAQWRKRQFIYYQYDFTTELLLDMDAHLDRWTSALHSLFNRQISLHLIGPKQMQKAFNQLQANARKQGLIVPMTSYFMRINYQPPSLWKRGNFV